MPKVETKMLSTSPEGVAPDGTEVRPLLSLGGGSLAHFSLAPGETSIAVAHRTVEEIWFFVSGRGEVWRKQKEQEDVTPVGAGLCVTIPLGTSFQFRAYESEPLVFIAATMPPWPGSDEAFVVEGPWTPSVKARP